VEISSGKDVGAQLIVQNDGLAILIVTCHNAANFHGVTLFKNSRTLLAMAASRRPHTTFAQKSESREL
jgi:hypothetical protein